MNLIDRAKYNEFTNVLFGCRTIMDAYYFAEKYSKNNPEMKNVISSMINGKRYEQILDFKTIKSVLENLDNIHYRDDAEEFIERYCKQTTDIAQIRALTRVTKNKILRPSNKPKISTTFISEIREDNYMVTKKCPHCKNDCRADANTGYVICGYTNTHKGYDWCGCGKDWCFKCEKMLCKSWEPNQLYVAVNRNHDGNCCKRHASETQHNYPEDYCLCSNENVINYFNENNILKQIDSMLALSNISNTSDKIV